MMDMDSLVSFELVGSDVSIYCCVELKLVQEFQVLGRHSYFHHLDKYIDEELDEFLGS